MTMRLVSAAFLCLSWVAMATVQMPDAELQAKLEPTLAKRVETELQVAKLCEQLQVPYPCLAVTADEDTLQLRIRKAVDDAVAAKYPASRPVPNYEAEAQKQFPLAKLGDTVSATTRRGAVFTGKLTFNQAGKIRLGDQWLPYDDLLADTLTKFDKILQEKAVQQYIYKRRLQDKEERIAYAQAEEDRITVEFYKASGYVKRGGRWLDPTQLLEQALVAERARLTQKLEAEVASKLIIDSGYRWTDGTWAKPVIPPEIPADAPTSWQAAAAEAKLPEPVGDAPAATPAPAPGVPATAAAPTVAAVPVGPVAGPATPAPAVAAPAAIANTSPVVAPVPGVAAAPAITPPPKAATAPETPQPPAAAVDGSMQALMAQAAAEAGVTPPAGAATTTGSRPETPAATDTPKPARQDNDDGLTGNAAAQALASRDDSGYDDDYSYARPSLPLRILGALLLFGILTGLSSFSLWIGSKLTKVQITLFCCFLAAAAAQLVKVLLPVPMIGNLASTLTMYAVIYKFSDANEMIDMIWMVLIGNLAVVVLSIAFAAKLAQYAGIW